MTTNGPIDDLDIVAYVDGELEPERIRELESWLSTHPEDAAKVHAYKLQNLLLSSLHEEMLSAPLPDAIGSAIEPPSPPLINRNGLRIAATLLLMLIGSLAGWGLNSLYGGNRAPEQKFVQKALKAHVVFISGGPGVSETAVGKDDKLTDVYAQHFEYPLKVPNLAGAGFRTTGRRLLTGDGGPSAQFMYKDAAGRMVTLYVQSGFDRSDMTFRLLAEDDMVAFYWTDGPLGYALTGSMERGDLLDLARMVYEKLPGRQTTTN
jgi:anti-sigma factor RsiW